MGSSRSTSHHIRLSIRLAHSTDVSSGLASRLASRLRRPRCSALAILLSDEIANADWCGSVHHFLDVGADRVLVLNALDTPAHLLRLLALAHIHIVAVNL